MGAGSRGEPQSARGVETLPLAVHAADCSGFHRRTVVEVGCFSRGAFAAQVFRLRCLGRAGEEPSGERGKDRARRSACRFRRDCTSQSRRRASLSRPRASWRMKSRSPSRKS